MSKLIILRGVSYSGKTWCVRQCGLQDYTLSSNHFRMLLNGDESDKSSDDEVFTLFNQILSRRIKNNLLTVIDAKSLDWKYVKDYVVQAKEAGMSVAVLSIQPNSLDISFNKDMVANTSEELISNQDLDKQIKEYVNNSRLFKINLGSNFMTFNNSLDLSNKLDEIYEECLYGG